MWLEISRVIPLSDNFLNVSLSSLIPIGSNPFIGSSNITKSGLFNIANAILIFVSFLVKMF
jgi:hypothetical protein